MRRKHNGIYVVKDTLTGTKFKGTLKEVAHDSKIPLTTISTALYEDRLIYRRYKVTYLG